ncbi:putative acyl-protein synthetase, LuxE [Hymenobacter roseosalivarius DSM 11622]|uniref:Putative acyl-protein synthetase, LuxE n=1 Tax=Hymenobacter roseosalivarius DSM 11622 TaxID=645990 RepID=A0A1W1W567_9BACT|nr:acyl transferase [Hymenobacter roseosalivarius]SMC00531.1 putative acyl-protein synthetase, LuxE [Hymenobacter roseosalivarius DSM 11622]
MSFRDEHLRALPTVSAANFEETALRLFRHQAENCPPYRDYLAALGRNPGSVNTLIDIPFLPIEFFKTHEVRTAPTDWTPQETFLSSGTTQQQRSRHLLRDPALYCHNAARIFEQTYGSLTDWIFLALLPSYLEQGQSSLVAMVEYFAKESSQTQPAFFLHDHAALLQALATAKCDSSRHIMLLGVSYALLDLVAAYAGAPELLGLTVLETGGMKGRRREMIREELHIELQTAFGPQGIHSEYGMTELLSQAYSTGNGRFICPPVLRILLREPSDPFSADATRPAGTINVIDLANIDSCAFIETKDLARQHSDGSFEVLGRLDNSDVRGCNQMV